MGTEGINEWYWPEAFVQAGVTQLNFTIPIYGGFILNENPQSFSLKAVATAYANATMYDVQTKEFVASYNCSIPVYAAIYG